MIIQAKEKDFDIVRGITRTTINEIYPKYYPRGAVEFFLAHHSDERIAKDISDGRVFLCIDSAGNAVGTVTISGNDIGRLFVLPCFQGHGYGRELIDFAENEIAKHYSEIVLDASLPAKAIYLKRGYTAAEYHIVVTENGDRLCYDEMKKTIADR